MQARVIFDANAAPDTTVSDVNETVDRAEFAARVRAVADILGQLPKMRICVPVTSDLGALAVLLAVLESAHSIVPMPGGEDVDVPPFCSAVVTATPDRDAPCSVQLTGVPPVADEEDRVYLRTSGTTGDPKWAVHSTSRMVRASDGIIERLELVETDRVMLPVALHHSYGLSTALIPSLIAGASIHIVPRGNPLSIFSAQREFKPNVMFLVPSQCRSIMALGRKAGALRMAVVAGDKLSSDEAAVFEKDFGPIVNLYGSTELNAITAGHPADPPELRHPFTGPPMRGMSLALEPTDDPDAAEGAEVMCVHHETGMLGYAGHTDGEMVLHAGDRWTTGDLVRRHDGDRIEVLGRTDFAVNRDGLLVHISDIEACLSRIPGVAQAVVAIAGSTRRGSGLHARCTLEDGASLDIEAILTASRAELPARAVPDTLDIVDDLPLLPSGKFDRRAITSVVVAELENGT